MSEFMLLSTDVSIWEASTKAKWGLLDFCPAAMHFQMWAIMPVQLNALSQVGAWWDVEKPQCDMAFMLIASNSDARCKRVFGVTTVWAYPCQVYLPMQEKAAHKLLLLVDDSPDWLYAFIQLHDTMSYVPCLAKDTLGLWQMEHPALMPAVSSISCKYKNYCNTGAGWYAQKG